MMCQAEYQAAVAAFIRTKSITHCATACAFRTYGTVAVADRATPQEYAAARERLRQQTIVARMQPFWTFAVLVPAAE